MKTFQLLPGDILLYEDRSVVGLIISAKTWHARPSHVEMALGNGETFTSRITLGARIYPFMRTGLYKVLRPVTPLNMQAVRDFIKARPSKPYGWWELTAFIGWEFDGPGEVCSATVTEALRAGGLDPFDGEPSRRVAPFQFDLSPAFKDYEIDGDTEVLP